jgi:tetraacyldisaccharide 4'-kinase
MKYFRIILLFPISLLYWLFTLLRNKSYDLGLIKTHKFNVAVIAVGNLSTGGTGKTPVVEYLTELLLKQNLNVAVLSRGYKRNTKGYKLVTAEMLAKDVGDEPYQIKRKLDDAYVAVCEKRVVGIKKLMVSVPDLDVIILDDAFQHRSVAPGLNILLSDYYKPFYKDWILPSGNLREAGANMKRADIMVVTKSPENISNDKINEIEHRIAPTNLQKLYFSHIIYGKLKSFNPYPDLDFIELNSSDYSVLLFAGISNPDPLLNYLKPKFREIFCMKFADHHNFTINDFEKINKQYRDIFNRNKIVITTEKDIARIENTAIEHLFNTMPLYYIPIKVSFHNNENEDNISFNTKILNYVRKDS